MTQNPDESHLTRAATLIAPYAESVTKAQDSRLDAKLPPDRLCEAVAAIDTAGWGYLSTITGLDHTDRFEVLYHFCEGGDILTLRVSLPHERPAVPTLCAIIPSALLQERELHEMFGIEVIDIPDASHLLLPDDWQAGVYPLRKDTGSTGGNDKQ